MEIGTPLVAVQPKWALVSKRILVNGLNFLIGGLLIAQELVPVIEDVYPVPDEWTKYILTLLAAANIILIRTSDRPVRFRRESVEQGVPVPRA